MIVLVGTRFAAGVRPSINPKDGISVGPPAESGPTPFAGGSKRLLLLCLSGLLESSPLATLASRSTTMLHCRVLVLASAFAFLIFAIGCKPGAHSANRVVGKYVNKHRTS